MVIQTERGRKIFRSNCVKPWTRPSWEQEINSNKPPTETLNEGTNAGGEEEGRTEAQTYAGIDEYGWTAGNSTKKEKEI